VIEKNVPMGGRVKRNIFMVTTIYPGAGEEITIKDTINKYFEYIL
jgi:hypothetical protein